MLKVHHLNKSRSERIIWLVEELGIDYEMLVHLRNPETFRAPPSLWEVSPMGKSPVIEDDGVVIGESGAIVEHILNKYGNGRLCPAKDSSEYRAFQHWMHAAESTLALPVLMDVLGAMTQTNSAGLQAFVGGEYKTVLGQLEKDIAGAYVAGAAFSAADIMVTYVLHLGNGTSIPGVKARVELSDYPGLTAYLQRV